MAHRIFLTPICAVPITVNQLAMECKSQLLKFLYVRIAEETLRPDEDNLIFTSKYPNWLSLPEPRISTISALGIETLRFVDVDYTLSTTSGSVTFLDEMTDTVRADYYYFPYSDQELTAIALKALQEISVLIFRPIDLNQIHTDYQAAVCKRLYTNLLKGLLLEARDYFSVSVGGRSINKTNIVTQISAIIEENEKLLQDEINVLRVFNKTNRMLPSIENTKVINSKTTIE